MPAVFLRKRNPQVVQTTRPRKLGLKPVAAPHTGQPDASGTAVTRLLDLVSLLGELVVGELPDVRPVVLEDELGDGSLRLKHALDQVIDPEVRRVRDELEDRGLHAVDAGEDLRLEVGLLLDSGDEVALRDD